MTALTLVRANGSRSTLVARQQPVPTPARWAATSAAAGAIDTSVQLTSGFLADSAERLEELADSTHDPEGVRRAAALFARCAHELDAVLETTTRAWVK